MEIKAVSLADYSSLRIGGEGRVISVSTVEELVEALMYAKSESLAVHFLGGGTNSYFGNDLKDFIFIELAFKGVNYTNEGAETLVTACASEVWDDLVESSVSKGLWGIENLSCIPGTVGAAPVQNIGAYGVELADVFHSLTALDTETYEIKTFTRDQCMFGYRSSLFKSEKGKYVITEVILRLYTEARPVLTYKPLDVLTLNKNLTVKDVRGVVARTRETKLPDWQVSPNAGSFFKNPVVDHTKGGLLLKEYPSMPRIEIAGGYKIPAAWLIEHVAEMKGGRIGDMGTWPSQALVLVNYGQASADDVDMLAQKIKEKIYTKTGILLEQEVNRVG